MTRKRTVMRRRIGTTMMKRTIGGWVHPGTRAIFRKRGAEWCVFSHSPKLKRTGVVGRCYPTLTEGVRDLERRLY
jgi:hypothetical protein